VYKRQTLGRVKLIIVGKSMVGEFLVCSAVDAR